MQLQQQHLLPQVPLQFPSQQQNGLVNDQNSTKLSHSIWKEAQLSIQNKEIPSARWGHSFVKANNDLLYLFGGYAESNYMNDSWTFNLNTFQWKQLNNQGGVIPEKRSNHSGCFLEKKNQILIFGGGGKEKKRFNDVHLFDITNNTWEQMNVSNTENMTPRTYHTANLFFDQYLAVFGGEGVGDLNDLCILSLEPEASWIALLIPGRAPPKRRFHSSAVVQNKLYILGGCFSNYRCHDDIWELNLGEYLQNPVNSPLEWKQIIHYNNVFQPRWGQCTEVYNDKIYIFGGRNLKDLNETIIFDPSKSGDYLVKIDQTSPNPRRRSASVVVGSTIVVFGGFDGIYYNDIHYLDIVQTECESSKKINNEQHFKLLQNLIYSQQNYDLELQFNSFKVGVHKIIIVERMNDPKNKGFLNKIETVDHINFYNKDFEQRFFINTIVQFMYSGVFDYKQIRNQKDLNQLQEFAYEIQLFTLLDALNQSEQWIRQEIQSSLVQRFNNYCFQRYFRFKQHQKKLSSFLNPQIKSKIDQSQNNKMIQQNIHVQNKVYDPSFILVNDSLWFEDNEIYYQYSDITLQCEGKQIHANKLLLSSQSLYFQTIFEFGFIEKTENVINIDIFSYNTTKIILNFLYFQKIIIPQCFDINDWLHLIEASKYFQIPRIQEICEIELVKLINEDNIINIYYFSILQNCPTLRQNCAQIFAIKMYKTSIFMDQNPDDFEDKIFSQMAIEAKYTYQMLRFQINQDQIVNEININLEKIEIEQDNSQICQKVQNFISDIYNWTQQEQIIFKLKRRNQQKGNTFKKEYQLYNNCIGNTLQNCYCSINTEQSYNLSVNNNSQSTLDTLDSQDSVCLSKQQIDYLNIESEKSQSIQYSKCISPIFQKQDFTGFTDNKFQPPKIQTEPIINQVSNHKIEQKHSINLIKNNQNNVYLSGSSHDHFKYGVNSNISKTSNNNCNSNFINHDSEEYEMIDNKMIDETQDQQFQTSIEYSN